MIRHSAMNNQDHLVFLDSLSCLHFVFVHHEKWLAGKHQSGIYLAQLIGGCVGQCLIIAASPGMILKAAGVYALYADGTMMFGRSSCNTQSKAIIKKAIPEVQRLDIILN